MPSVRQISRRIRSVENTAKITKAMSMIAASKLRRSQEAATMGRSYRERMASMVTNLMGQLHDKDDIHSLLTGREVNVAAVVLVTPDRGLTGGLNSNILREVGDYIENQGDSIKILAVGKKGSDYARRAGLEGFGQFVGVGDRPKLEDTLPITEAVITEFVSGQVDSVAVAYTRFVNTTSQIAVVEPLLPIDPHDFEDNNNRDYILEPDASDVLARILPRYVGTIIHHAILESIASEQSARMVAMNNATDNANEMVEDLTLVMNKLRQESITNELLDIVGGVAAIEN